MRGGSMTTLRKLQISTQAFNIDWALVIFIVLLSIISFIAIYGAIPLMPAWVNGQGILIRQVVWYFLGFLVLGFLIHIGIDRLFSMATFFYWILMGLLLLLSLDFVIDIPFVSVVNGSRAWIQLPGIGTIQPSEFMKIIIIIKASEIIQQHQQFQLKMSFWNDILLFIKIAKLLVLPLILIIIQPDTGIPIVIVVSTIVMLAMSAIKPHWIIWGSVLVFIMILSFIYVFETNPRLLADVLGGSYRLNRIYGWLQPEKYILTWGAQLYTALLAIGSAGLHGLGAASAAITFPEPQNDFIFAVIAKNYGLIGVGFTLLISLLFNLKILSVALKHDGLREKYMVAGLLGMLFYQQLQNIGMVVGILPITGITLPLISSGGSSLISYMIPFAIIFHMSNENKNKGK